MTVSGGLLSESRVFDGVTTAFPLSATFQFIAASDLSLTLVRADGSEAAAPIGASGIALAGDGMAGSASLIIPLGVQTGFVSCRIDRATRLVQDAIFASDQSFPAKAAERALDRAMLALQEQQGGLGRALQVPRGETAPALPAAATRAGRIFGWLTGTGSAIAMSAAEVADWLLAAIVARLPAGLKGDPGGTAMAIGLFTAAGGLDIANGVDRVRTSGHSVVGKGGADYVYEAAVDAAYVDANPITSFRNPTTGRGYRLAHDQEITPFMFGALGYEGFHGETTPRSSLPDDTAAVQAFFTFLGAGRVPSANWGGVFGVTAGLIFGTIDSSAQEFFGVTDSIAGHLVLVPKSNINGAVLTIRNRRYAEYGNITVYGSATGRDLSTRVFDVGVQVDTQSQMQRFSGISVHHARHWGAINMGVFPSNAYQNDFGTVHFSLCGSGCTTDSPEAFLSSPFGSHTRLGNAGLGDQRSVIGGVDVFPPASVRNGVAPVFVLINGQWRRVVAWDVGNRAFEAWPWVTGALTGTLQYVYGGGLLNEGGDGGMLRVKGVANGCGIGVHHRAVYGGEMDMTFQLCAIGFVNGRGQGFVDAFTDYQSFGAGVSLYFEHCALDLLDEGIGTFTIDRQVNLSVDKWEYLRPLDVAGNRTDGRKTSILANFGGWKQAEEPEASPALPVAFNSPFKDLMEFRRDAAEVWVGQEKAGWDRIFGYRKRLVLINGTNVSGAPTSITVRPWDFASGAASNWAKIDGGVPGAAKTFAGFNGPVLMLLRLNPDDLTDVQVRFLSGKETSLSATAAWDPPSLATATQQSTTVAVAGAALGDLVEVSFSLALSGTQLWGEVTAPDTVTVHHRNDTGGAVDLGAGTLRARVRKP